MTRLRMYIRAVLLLFCVFHLLQSVQLCFVFQRWPHLYCRKISSKNHFVRTLHRINFV